MNQNAVVQLISIAVVLFGALFGMMFVLDAPGNNLSRAFYFCIGCGFLMAILNPKSGMILLLFSAGYLDLLKRFLILYGNVNMMDLMTILGTAPIIFAGVCLSIFVIRFLHGINFSVREWLVIVLAGIMVVIIILASYNQYGSLMRGVAYGANAAAYVPLLLMAGILYPTYAEQKRFLKILCLIFLPVCIYGIWQFFAGYNTLEVAYMQSGLTKTISHLNESITRPFSTMNSAHSFSIIMASLSALTIIMAINQKQERKFWSFLALCFTMAAVLSVARTAWVMLVMILLGSVIFRKKSWTIIFYVLSLIFFIVVAWWGEFVLDRMFLIVGQISPESDFARRALTVGTFYDRVASFQAWATNPEAWSWFGKGEVQAAYYVHDQIGQILHVYGGVVLVSSILMGVAFLYFCHRRLFQLEDPEQRNLAVIYLSLVYGLIFTGMLSGGHITVFPVNLFFWLIVGFLTKFFLLPDQAPARRPVQISIQASIPGRMIASANQHGRGMEA